MKPRHGKKPNFAGIQEFSAAAICESLLLGNLTQELELVVLLDMILKAKAMNLLAEQTVSKCGTQCHL